MLSRRAIATTVVIAGSNGAEGDVVIGPFGVFSAPVFGRSLFPTTESVSRCDHAGKLTRFGTRGVTKCPASGRWSRTRMW